MLELYDIEGSDRRSRRRLPVFTSRSRVRGVKANAECSVRRTGPTTDITVVESAETLDEKEFQMEICFPPLTREEVMIGKKQHCFEIPSIIWPPREIRRPGLDWWT